jgi:cytoskeleton protein RodZ
MTSIGETLRRERLKRKLGLEGISKELKISARLLEAIEEERFDKLPGGVFAKSFVRQYARLLGLDEEEIVAELQRILDPQAPPPQPAPAPLQDAGVPLPRVEAWESAGDMRVRRSSPLRSLAMVVFVMLFCSAIYGWWQRGGHLPWRLPVRESAPAAVETVPASPPPVAQPATEDALQPQPAVETPAATAQEQAVAADVRKESADAPLPPLAAPNADAPVRVQITAQEQEEVWVSARADGKFLFAVTLQPNESRTVEAGKTVLLKLGNAGGVNFLLNGNPVGPVGPKGQVRSVQFTSGGFQIVVPEAPSPPALPKDLLDPF